MTTCPHCHRQENSHAPRCAAGPYGEKCLTDRLGPVLGPLVLAVCLAPPVLGLVWGCILWWRIETR